MLTGMGLPRSVIEEGKMVSASFATVFWAMNR